MAVERFPSFSDQAACLEHHEENARIFRRGEWWLAPHLTAERLQVSETTVQKFATTHPKHGGPVLIPDEFQGADGWPITYYSEASVKALREYRVQLKHFPEVPGWVYIEDATAELGVSLRTLRREMEKRKARPMKKPARSSDDRVRRRSYVPRWVVDAIAKDRVADPLPPGKIDSSEAAEELGLARVTVHALADKGELRKTDGRIRSKGGYTRKGKRFSREQVERLAEERERRQKARPEPYADEEGVTWVPAMLGPTVNPAATPDLLYRCANKPCPNLGGEVLVAKEKPWPTGRAGRRPRLWFRKDQLQRVVKAEKGQHATYAYRQAQGPGEPMAGAAQRTEAERDPGSQARPEEQTLSSMAPYPSTVERFGPQAIEQLSTLLALRGEPELYITGKEAARLTALSPSTLSRLCKEGGPIRFRRPQPQRLEIHVGDLIKYMRDHEETEN